MLLPIAAGSSNKMISKNVTTGFNYMEVIVDLNNSNFNELVGAETGVELDEA